MRGSRKILCRLALAVVVGTLQYLVPATPNAIGAYFLHYVYPNIHDETLENFDDIHDFYHSGLALGALARADFSWWEQALASGLKERKPWTSIVLCNLSSVHSCSLFNL
jgi:hypothetical protein